MQQCVCRPCFASLALSRGALYGGLLRTTCLEQNTLSEEEAGERESTISHSDRLDGSWLAERARDREESKPRGGKGDLKPHKQPRKTQPPHTALSLSFPVVRRVAPPPRGGCLLFGPSRGRGRLGARCTPVGKLPASPRRRGRRGSSGGRQAPRPRAAARGLASACRSGSPSLGCGLPRSVCAWALALATLPLVPWPLFDLFLFPIIVVPVAVNNLEEVVVVVVIVSAAAAPAQAASAPAPLPALLLSPVVQVIRLRVRCRHVYEPRVRRRRLAVSCPPRRRWRCCGPRCSSPARRIGTPSRRPRRRRCRCRRRRGGSGSPGAGVVVVAIQTKGEKDRAQLSWRGNRAQWCLGGEKQARLPSAGLGRLRPDPDLRGRAALRRGRGRRG